MGRHTPGAAEAPGEASGQCRDGVLPLHGMFPGINPRGLSPRGDSAPASLGLSRNKISARRRSPGAAEPPATCSPPGAAEAHERMARVMCEAVREAVREEFREATVVLQDAVRSEVSRMQAAGARASGKAQAAGLNNKANADSPEELRDMDMDIQVEKMQTINHHLTRRMTCEPTKETNDSDSEVWTLVLDGVPCCRSCLMRIRGAYCLLGNVEAPPRSDPFSKLVDSKWFSTFVHVIILLNSGFMLYAADQEIRHYNETHASRFVLIGEVFFLIAYSIEFVAKIWRYHWYFFCNSSWKLNCVDLFLLLLSAWSVCISEGFPNFSWMRTLRMLRVFKVVRVLRLMSLVKPLRAILQSMFQTMGTFFWSVALLLLILALFALVLVMRVTTYLKDQGDSVDESVKEELLSAYGGIITTFNHLFIATTNGNNWTAYYSPLQATGTINCGIYYFFVLFTQISVLNIILGVFVDTAMKSMEPDREDRIRDHAKSQKEMSDNLMKLCVEADTDNDGKLSEAELQAAMRSRKLIKYLEILEWRPSEATDFLNQMFNGTTDGALDIDVIVRAAMRFKGAASCYDMQIVLNAVEELRRHIQIAVREGEWRDVPPGAGSPLWDGDREPPSSPEASPLRSTPEVKQEGA